MQHRRRTGLNAREAGRAAGIRDLRPLSFLLLGALCLLAWAIYGLAPAQAQGAPDLAVTVTESADPVEVGSSLSYTITVTNVSEVVSPTSYMVAILDPAFESPNISGAGIGCSNTSGLLYCEIVPLEAQDSASTTITGTVGEGFALFLPATLETADSNSANDSWVEDTQIGTEILPPGPTSLAPTDDAFVKSTLKKTNFGSLATLEVDRSPHKVALLRFDLSGTPLNRTGATLRLHVSDGSPNAGDIYLSDGTAWSEDTVTWASRPRWVGSPIASIGAVNAGNWYEISLPVGAVNGDETTLFILSPSSNETVMSSKEGPNPPELIVLTTHARYVL